MKNIVLEVNGMSCMHCENRVIKSVKGLKGVKKVQASAEENKVIVDYKEAKVTLEQIKQAIIDAGYDVV